MAQREVTVITVQVDCGKIRFTLPCGWTDECGDASGGVAYLAIEAMAHWQRKHSQANTELVGLVAALNGMINSNPGVWRRLATDGTYLQIMQSYGVGASVEPAPD